MLDKWQPGQNPIDMKKLRYALIEKKLGSFLNPISVASPDLWQQFIRAIQDVAVNETAHKIPVLYGIDSIHGATWVENGTLYPQPLSMAASFNPEIAKKYGELVAKEQKASGIPWNFRFEISLSCLY